MIMDCRDLLDLIYPYLDGELEATAAAAVAAHARTCPSCAKLIEEQRQLSHAIRIAAPSRKAPERLKLRIAEALVAEAARPAASAAPVAVSPAPRRLPWRPLALAASLALAVVTSSGLTAYFTQPSDGDRLAQGIVANHVRSLMADHLTDVQSSDQHTVKPWFNGKLDLSPPVDDLAAEGYPLIGGRIDYVEQRPVAALVYRHRQHPINLFVLPAAVAAGGSESYIEHGYNVLHWRHGDLSLWAASDLNLTELREFQRLYEAKSPPAM
jgi:mycothiol system anti-sigma-R factor